MSSLPYCAFDKFTLSGGAAVFAARANVCVAAPAYQISSAIRVFVRILDMGV